MKVKVHLYAQAEPFERDSVRNAYQKGDFYCVMMNDGKTVYKFPIQHIFRVTEVSDSEGYGQ
ncbi:MAG: hypothetical protein HYT20_00610 [Candidatus Nealsonbacteria bacterium]|nr:hypothetical protein [Candidatus Nealsonbacteria bacterium]